MLEPTAQTLDPRPRASDAAADASRVVAASDDAHVAVSDEAGVGARDEWANGGPFVSVVVPCLNEERFIGQVVERLLAQYEEGRLEIVVVDGLSTDGTRAAVAECAARHASASVRLVDNPARHIPVALNLGIEAARGEVIVRMDAHSLPSENYVRRCVELLRKDAGEVVGMPWRISAGDETPAARAVALAVAHPFGIGDAQYRLSPKDGGPRAVDTVPFGVFRKSLWRRLGGFNERLLANEDYDFNYRVRQAGGRVVLDSAAHSTYFARATLSALARQYFRYGHWKAQMLKLHPRSVRPRQLAAPVFVASLAALTVASLASFAFASSWLWIARWLLLAELVMYLLPACYFAASLARRSGEGAAVAARVVAAFFVIHAAWGAGFWRGLARRRAAETR